MKKKINLIDIHYAIQQKLAEKGVKAYDIVPEDTMAPFICVQFIDKTDESTKTMYLEDFKFYIHCFAEGGSSIKVYELINQVEEALTEDIEIEELVNQTEDGIVQVLTEEETHEKRAILSYTFRVCYGFKCKI